MIYEFPSWAEKGNNIIDVEGVEWTIADTYVSGAYNHDWGVLRLEHPTIPGLTIEEDVCNVYPKDRQNCKTCGLPEFFTAMIGEATCGCP